MYCITIQPVGSSFTSALGAKYSLKPTSLGPSGAGLSWAAGLPGIETTVRGSVVGELGSNFEACGKTAEKVHSCYINS